MKIQTSLPAVQAGVETPEPVRWLPLEEKATFFSLHFIYNNVYLASTHKQIHVNKITQKLYLRYELGKQVGQQFHRLTCGTLTDHCSLSHTDPEVTLIRLRQTLQWLGESPL